MAKILLLDDERASSELLKMALEFDGFEVAVSYSLPDARQALTEDTRAVVLDHHLHQGQTGLTLLKEIRAGKTVIDRLTPVIVTSGDDRCEPEANTLQASLFLTKPFSPAVLADQLRELIDGEPNRS